MAFEDRWKRVAGVRTLFQVPDKAEFDALAAGVRDKFAVTDNTGLINPTTTDEPYGAGLTFNVDSAGDYLLQVNVMYSMNITIANITIKMFIDGTELQEFEKQPSDSAGIGVTLPTTTGGTSNTGTDQRVSAVLTQVQNLAAGSHTLTITFSSGFTSIGAAIHSATYIAEELS